MVLQEKACLNLRNNMTNKKVSIILPVYNGAEHAFIYDITNGEQLAHINKSCNACNYDQIMNLSKGYLIEGTNVISVSSGGYESKTSDITYTLNGEVHTVVFDRYTGNVKSIN